MINIRDNLNSCCYWLSIIRSYSISYKCYKQCYKCYKCCSCLLLFDVSKFFPNYLTSHYCERNSQHRPSVSLVKSSLIVFLQPDALHTGFQWSCGVIRKTTCAFLDPSLAGLSILLLLLLFIIVIGRFKKTYTYK